MWAYLGTADPTHAHVEELSSAEVKKVVRSLTILGEDEPCDIELPVLPYEASHPLPKILDVFIFDYAACIFAFVVL